MKTLLRALALVIALALSACCAAAEGEIGAWLERYAALYEPLGAPALSTYENSATGVYVFSLQGGAKFSVSFAGGGYVERMAMEAMKEAEAPALTAAALAASDDALAPDTAKEIADGVFQEFASSGRNIMTQRNNWIFMLAVQGESVSLTIMRIGGMPPGNADQKNDDAASGGDFWEGLFGEGEKDPPRENKAPDEPRKHEGKPVYKI